MLSLQIRGSQHIWSGCAEHTLCHQLCTACVRVCMSIEYSKTILRSSVIVHLFASQLREREREGEAGTEKQKDRDREKVPSSIVTAMCDGMLLKRATSFRWHLRAQTITNTDIRKPQIHSNQILNYSEWDSFSLQLCAMWSVVARFARFECLWSISLALCTL